MLSAFRARSGRYQPSNAKFVFGPSKYLRFLIKPPEGMGIGYIDYEQQEFAIAAVKGNDSQMWDDYDTGDPYMALAIRAGGAPRGATKVTNPRERALYKTCALALNYGMGARSLAFRIKQQVVYARELIQANHRVYPDFWRYSDNVVDNAMGYGYLDTGLGWRMHVTEEDHKTPALRNFPMQATGAEMIRLACCLATERGIQVCCPVHDALLVMAPVEVLDEAIHNTRTAMAEASKIILGGYEIRTEVDKRVVYPNRFTDERGRDMWELVNRLSTQFGSRHDN
jgi:DNA polymerase I-like protein with 3'-5' exonuclease and polymerase domains